MNCKTEPIGKYIKLVDRRNSDLSVSRLLGININKEFMPTVANTSDLDISKYKIVSSNQFACNLMHVGRDERFPIALSKKTEDFIVSPAYFIFELIDTGVLLPEFLMMLFKMTSTEKKGWFFSDSSIRGGLEWERFCEIEMPVPSLENQKKYVAIYNSIMENQKLYEDSIADLELICNSYIEAAVKR